MVHLVDELKNRARILHRQAQTDDPAAVLRGEETADFGTLLYPKGADVHSNIWCATYEQARKIREQNSGYLLAYRRHFFIVDRHFIETLGLDPEDPDWDSIGRDWVRPLDPAARERLYSKLIRSRAPEILDRG